MILVLVDAAWQVALSVEVPLVEPPLEDEGRGKGSGMVVVRLIPSMSMSMDKMPNTVVALLSPPMSLPDLVTVVELQLQSVVLSACSDIAQLYDAASRSFHTWHFACWEGSI